MNDSKYGTVKLSLLFLVGIIAISFSSIFIRWSNAPVSVIAMNRLFLTTLLMLPFLFNHRSAIQRISLRSWFEILGSGTALALHFLFWMESLRYTTVASSTAILALMPVFVLMGACLFFRQRTHFLAILSMGTAIIGAIMIGWGDWGLTGDALLGDGLSFLGMIAVAAHMLMGKRLLRNIPSFVYGFFVFLFAAAVLAVYNLVMGYSLFNYSLHEWNIFLMLAIVPTLFGHYLFTWLLKFMRPETVSMSVLGEPLGATLLAYFLLGEKITWMQAGAGTLLLFGVWMFLRFDKHPAAATKTRSPEVV